jgi:hypothetical protein
MKIFIGKDEFDIPQGWNTVSTKAVMQIFRLPPEDDFPAVIAAILDLPKERIQNINKNDYNNILAPLLAWAYVMPDAESVEMPEHLIINENVVKIPKNIEYETIGQEYLLRTNMQNNTLFDLIPLAVAIYAQKQIDGTFNEQKAYELAKDIELLPFMQTYPVAIFFFQKLRESMKSELNSLNKEINQHLTNTEIGR